MGEFEPEYAGKLNFYLSAVDDILKKETNNPSIGILLCKTKNNIIAEYALRDMTKPIGVSEYKIMKRLPKELKKELPSIDGEIVMLNPDLITIDSADLDGGGIIWQEELAAAPANPRLG